jgi:hypothetical protein
MKIWLDDDFDRAVPAGWHHVSNADDCIDALMHNDVTAISLDRDLGDVRMDPYPHEVTGEDVVRWMIEHDKLPAFINIHSWNIGGAQRMSMAFYAVGRTVSCEQYSEFLIKELEK